MKALQFVKSVPRYLLVRGLGRKFRGLATSGLAPLRLVDLPEPSPPGPEWVLVRTHLSGICGSDLATITCKGSFYFQPYTSFPFVLGHEIIGEIARLGPATRGWQVGERVAVEPALSCRVRGLEPVCRACASGHYPSCERVAEGALAAGVQTGYCRDTGGGWSPYLVAHPYQLHRLPSGLSEASEILVEPFSCALHAALRGHVTARDRVLIWGAGTMGLLTLAALRLLEPACRISIVARYGHQEELASALGADCVLRDGGDLYKTLAEHLEAPLHYPDLGKPVSPGGADIAFDCVGASATVDECIRFTRSQGRVVLVGMPAHLSGLEGTALWHKEIQLCGVYTYAFEQYGDRRLRTFELALELMRQTQGRLDPLVGARFPLNQYKQAIQTALSTGRSRVVKTVFDLRD